jgi:RNA polymerase sigma factor (sigma-70 family)
MDMDDRALLARVRDGEERAFGELFDRHARPVLAFARSRLSIKADADDIAQSAFVLLWEKRRDLELAGTSALPWLLGTVRLLALASARTAARRGVGLDAADNIPDPRLGPERTAEVLELDELVVMSIGALDEVDREVFRLCIDEGRSYAEAASVLGLTPTTLRGRLARLRRRLRAELEILKGA